MGTFSIRVLVVEDYESFRRFLISTLQNMSEVRDIHEVLDGSEAVQEVQRLQPGLILLDIGLPKLKGMEAARRIRKLSPTSKIIFVTQESSPDVVQEALGLGALGYVVRAHTGSELMAAVEAMRQGRLFVSAGWRVKDPPRSPTSKLPRVFIPMEFSHRYRRRETKVPFEERSYPTALLESLTKLRGTTSVDRLTTLGLRVD